MKKKKVSFVLTTLNEYSYIRESVSKIFSIINPYELIIVDDSSSNQTKNYIKKLNHPRITFISRKNDKGLASAILRGVVESKGEIICWMDTGMYYLLEEYKKMINCLEKYDIVILSRYIKGGIDKRNKIRSFSSLMLNLFCRFIFSNAIKDYSSGLFVLKRSALDTELPDGKGYGEYIIKYLYLCKKKGLKIKELPYTHTNQNEEISNTSSSYLKFFYLGIKYLVKLILFRIRDIFK